MTLTKKRGQFFTPDCIADKLIDFAEISSGELYGKRILDCSCGSGNILKPLVERYVREGRQIGYSSRDIKHALENNIVGLDIDQNCCEICSLRLSEIAEANGLEDVSWRILNVDALRVSFSQDRFDLVIGNPPYIDYHDLDTQTRDFLRDAYSVCGQGRFDYYYPFFEFGINCLSDSGKLCYLIPNSIFKNVFAARLRQAIKPLLSAVGDFKTKKVFEALTSSAFVRLEKEKHYKNVHYYDFDSNLDFFVEKTQLEDGKKWVFALPGKASRKKGSTFGEKYRASCPVATLCNDVFLIDADFVLDKNDSHLLLKDGSMIERNATRVAISPKSHRCGKSMLVIFPYAENGKGVRRLTDNELEMHFPGTYRFLSSHRERLDRRSSDGGCRWFEYGRSQGLANLSENRLLISTVITNKINVIELSPGVVPYSGIVIAAVGDNALAQAKIILKSNAFLEYVHLVGTNVSGSSIRISSKDVNQFIVQGC